MRRLGAFMMYCIAVAAIPLCIVFNVDWKLAACAIGIPGIIGTLLLLFTTWQDVKEVVSAVTNKEA